MVWILRGSILDPSGLAAGIGGWRQHRGLGASSPIWTDRGGDQVGRTVALGFISIFFRDSAHLSQVLGGLSFSVPVNQT